jgi:hypothetical protein
MSTRFASPTSDFDLGVLLGNLRKLFWAFLGLAIGAHLLVVGINPFEQVIEKTPRPLTTKFVKREPRLTKPLELRKVPKPKRQMIRRQVQLAQARMDQVQATAAFNTRGLLNQVAAPDVNLARNVDLGSLDLEPTLTAGDISGTREPDNKIDMALEMLDVNSMDTGRYRAMLVQDPNDPQAIKGFINFARVLSARALAAGEDGNNIGGTTNIRLLVEGLNEFTGIQAKFIGSVTYDDERLLEIPIILPSGNPNESELEQLTQYLLSGGFVFGGIGFIEEGLEKYGGLVRGRDFYNERLPNDHPVFSAYFDVKGGAPSGARGTQKNGQGAWRPVTGHYVKGRLVGISGIGGYTNAAFDRDATRHMQMALNVIIYALTQEGSMTQRLMQMVN